MPIFGNSAQSRDLVFRSSALDQSAISQTGLDNRSRPILLKNSCLSYCLTTYLPLTLMSSSTAIPLPTGWSMTSAIVFTAVPGAIAGVSC